MVQSAITCRLQSGPAVFPRRPITCGHFTRFVAFSTRKPWTQCTKFPTKGAASFVRCPWKQGRVSIACRAESVTTENQASNSSQDGDESKSQESQESVLRPMKEIVAGETYEGTVVGITSFGCFVDFGFDKEALIHISELSLDFIEDPSKAFQIKEKVTFIVLAVDLERQRIKGSIKQLLKGESSESSESGGEFSPDKDYQQRSSKDRSRKGGRKTNQTIPFKVGEEVSCTVYKVNTWGAFCDLPGGFSGLLHVSEMTGIKSESADPEALPSAADYVKEGDDMSLRIREVKDTKISLTQKTPEDIAQEQEVRKDGLSAFPEEEFPDVFGIQFGRQGIESSNFVPLPEGVSLSYDEEDASAELEAQTLNSSAGETTSETVELELELEQVEPASAVAEGGEDTSAVARAEVEDSPAVAEAEVEDSPAVAEAEVEDTPAVAEAEVEDTPAVAEAEVEDTPAVAEEVEDTPAVAEEVEDTPAVAEEVEDTPAVAEEVEDTPAVAEEVEDSPAVADTEQGSPDVVEKEAANPVSVEAKSSSSGAPAISAQLVKQLREISGAGMMDCKRALTEANGDMAEAEAALKKKGIATAAKKAGRIAAEGAVGSYIHNGSRLGVLIEVNCETDFVARGPMFKELVENLAMQVAASPDAVCVSVDDFPADVLEKERQIELAKEDLQSKPEEIREKMVEGRLAKMKKTSALLEQAYIRDSEKTVKDVVTETISTVGENISIRRFERFNLGEGLEKRSTDFATEVAEQTKQKESAPEAADQEPPKEEPSEPKADVSNVQVSAKDVKALRVQSGAGMMDCKKALQECGGDMEEAAKFLKVKGMASADKKAGRIAAEGAIGSYIHTGSRLGVMAEINCETDFVARGDIFKELVEDMCMQIAASPDVQYVREEDIPKEVLDKEREIELGKEDLQSKPEGVREKMVEGRLKKYSKTLSLLDQPFVKDNDKTVGEALKEVVATTGENIQIRRFTRFNLGEGLEKRSDDFAAEVAAQTGGI